MNIDKDIIGKPPNQAVVINEQLIKRAESYKQEDEQEPLIIDGEELDAEKLDADRTCPNQIGQASIDTREQLEADIDCYRDEECRDYLRVPVYRVHSWLKRQAAITERELYDRCSPYATAKDYLDTIDSLTAERDEAIEIRDQAYGDAATFKAERDGLKRQLENQAAYIAGVEDSLCRCESQLVRDGKDIDGLTAERDELNMRVNGLIGELGDTEGTALRLQAECDHLRKVVQQQAESFRKMEVELSKAKAVE